VILVDSSIWIDHLRKADRALSHLLARDVVLVHPFVVGELAMGSLGNRLEALSSLQELSRATVARDEEVLAFLDMHKLFSIGIGYIDAHLLASTHLTPGATLWTRDKRLDAIATRLAIVYHP